MELWDTEYSWYPNGGLDLQSGPPLLPPPCNNPPAKLGPETSERHLLCPQVGPSQPSLQMQVKASPPPTQVPPLEHGLEAQVLFLAGWPVENVLELSSSYSLFGERSDLQLRSGINKRHFLNSHYNLSNRAVLTFQNKSTRLC